MPSAPSLSEFQRSQAQVGGLLLEKWTRAGPGAAPGSGPTRHFQTAEAQCPTGLRPTLVGPSFGGGATAVVVFGGNFGARNLIWPGLSNRTPPRTV